jgi:hypothetical protein
MAMNRRVSRCGWLASGFALLALAGTASAADTLAGVGWLAGVWQTPVTQGAQTEYVYIPLFNGQMLSTMVALRNGQATRYELRVIKLQDGQVVFRELAFKPDLSSADPVPLRPLHSATAQEITFTDMKVTRTGENSATMQLTLHPAGEPPRSITVPMRRTLTFAKAG